MTYRPAREGKKDIVGRGVIPETTPGLTPTLRSGTVVQDPASATTFPTPNAIVMAYPNSKIDVGWLPDEVLLKSTGLEWLQEVVPDNDNEEEDLEFLM